MVSGAISIALRLLWQARKDYTKLMFPHFFYSQHNNFIQRNSHTYGPVGLRHAHFGVIISYSS